MIRKLTGVVVERNISSVVLDVGGVGYLIAVPVLGNDYAEGKETSLFTHLAVRENALDLYGFSQKRDLEMFELLIELPKIGPKTALQIMSQADVSLLEKAALSSDPDYLHKMSGIGKKTAEKIVIGLKEKLGGDHAPLLAHEQGDSDVIDALITLGYSQKEARDAVAKLPSDITEPGARIRESLKFLGKQ